MIPASTLHLVAALIGALAFVTLALAVFLAHAAAGRQCSESQAESDAKLSSLATRVPVSEIRDDLIVRRDGSFCAGWECSGIATQFASAERLEAVSSALDGFIRGIRHPEVELQFRYLIDHETPRVLEGRKALGNFVNSPAGWLEENRLAFWRSGIDAGQMRSIRLLAFVSWKPKHTWHPRSVRPWPSSHNSARRLIGPELVELVYHALNPADRQLQVTPMSEIALTVIGVVNKSGGVPALRASMAAQPPKPAGAEAPTAETLPAA